jgi:hypothetical protein
MDLLIGKGQLYGWIILGVPDGFFQLCLATARDLYLVEVEICYEARNMAAQARCHLIRIAAAFAVF